MVHSSEPVSSWSDSLHAGREISNRFRYFSEPNVDPGDGFEVTTLGFIHVPPGADYPPTGHPESYTYCWSDGRRLSEYQVHFISRGYGSLQHDAGGIGEVSVGPGTTFLLFPHVWHRYAPAAEIGWSEFWIGLRGGQVDQLMRSQAISEREPAPVCADTQQILVNFSRALSTLNSCDAMAREVRRASATLILAALRTRSRRLASESPSLIWRATEILKDTAGDDIGMGDVARRIGVGYHTLRRVFKTETGLTLQQWRNEYRMRQAAAMLRDGSVAVKQAALRCGFEDPYYFSRAFQKHFGVSPTLYRANLRS